MNVVCPGRVATDIARDLATKSIVHRGIVGIYNALLCVSPDVGARALVMAATTTPAEHGKFLRPYMTDAEYERYARY